MVIKINENQYRYYVMGLNEDVFVNDVDDNKKTAHLVYNQTKFNNNGAPLRNRGNKNSQDMLKTDKMDVDNNDTYEVPLKGGIVSYNITSINGNEVMHFFKRRWDNASTTMKFKKDGEEYKLYMNDHAFLKFMVKFNKKVNNVVNWRIKEITQWSKDVIFDKVSIYPVPSSSSFNRQMANALLHTKSNICGLPVQIVNPDLLKKDTINLQMDDEFIDKNKDYYNELRFQGDNYKHFGTHLDAVNNEVNRLKVYAEANIPQVVDEINTHSKFLISELYKIGLKQFKADNLNNRDFYRQFVSTLGDKKIKRLSDEYQAYCNKIEELRNLVYYDANGKEHSLQLRSLIKWIKYTKKASVDERTTILYNIIKVSQYGGWLNFKNKCALCEWESINFQIKSIANDIRMGLKNLFQPNKDMPQEEIQKEVEKTKGGIVVIFDDNVSGGGTLSDICMGLQKLGMENIIPITFGKMGESYNVGQLNVNRPKDNKFNY